MGKQTPDEPIGISPQRQAHMLAVAQLMRDRAILFELDEQAMFLLGFLHDIGYAFTADKMKHEQIGSDILEQCGFEYAEAVRYHGEPYPPEEAESTELLLLQWCDMNVGPHGNILTIDERIFDIEERFGINSPTAQKARAMRERLQQKIPYSPNY